MKEVLGVDLKAVTARAVTEAAAEHESKIVAKIKQLVTNIRTWQTEKDQKTKELEKLAGKIGGAESQLAKLQAGDWTALKDDNQGQQDGKDKSSDESKSNG